jgi:hypothetical protein
MMRTIWNIAPCNLVGVDRRFSGAYCLHSQGDETSSYSKDVTRRYSPEGSLLYLLCRHPVGLLGQGVGPSQRPLPTQDSTTRKDEDKHQCSEHDSNPWSQYPTVKFHNFTAWSLPSAGLIFIFRTLTELHRTLGKKRLVTHESGECVVIRLITSVSNLFCFYKFSIEHKEISFWHRKCK